MYSPIVLSTRRTQSFFARITRETDSGFELSTARTPRIPKYTARDRNQWYQSGAHGRGYYPLEQFLVCTLLFYVALVRVMVSARIFMNFTRFLEARNRVGTWIGSSLIRRQCALDRARYALFSANSAFSVCNAHTRYLVCMSTRCRTHELQIKPNQVTALRILRRNLHVSCARGAGHNKWSKIKRHKAVTDLEKSKLRGKLLDQIRAAVASGGNDTSTNIKLSSLLSQAKSSRVPKSNIEAALKHSSLGDTACESVLYEGRGPSGYLVLIDALTDNRNRTRPEIRQIIEKQG